MVSEQEMDHYFKGLFLIYANVTAGFSAEYKRERNPRHTAPLTDCTIIWSE